MTIRPKLTLERSFRAPITDVWELWTTQGGIESWWGPEGFTVRVRQLDLRPGGQLLYVMSATGAEQIDYMRKASMPITTEHSLTYTEVKPQRRLAYRHMADFIPGVEPYEVETVLELSEGGNDEEDAAASSWSSNAQQRRSGGVLARRAPDRPLGCRLGALLGGALARHRTRLAGELRRQLLDALNHSADADRKVLR